MDMLLVILASLFPLLASPPAEEGRLEDVVIKGEQKQKPSASKPLLSLRLDESESIRESLKPEESLLLAEHPVNLSWINTNPPQLFNRRVIQTQGVAVQSRIEIRFEPRSELLKLLGKPLHSKELKGWSWSLILTDEEGRLFHRFEGKGMPPEFILWNGRGERGMIKAGGAYSPLYRFTDAQNKPMSAAGSALRFDAVVEENKPEIKVNLNSASLFGPDKQARRLPESTPLLEETADWIKRHYPRASIKVRAYAQSVALGEDQAKAVKEWMAKELMLRSVDIPDESREARFGDQRIELLLANF